MIPDWLVPAPADREQLGRLAAFRAARPEVIIGPGGFGTWQAVIAAGGKEIVKTGDTLRDLLDKLDKIFPPGSEAKPGGDQPAGPDG
jgi:hypothetical protein